jgi:Coenzyme PQQ synthesis protein D (PqqD)
MDSLDNTKYQLRTSKLTWRVVDDSVIVLDLVGSIYLSVSGAGRLMWKALESGASTEDLVRLVLETYDAPREIIQTDAHNFVAELLQKNLITTVL